MSSRTPPSFGQAAPGPNAPQAVSPAARVPALMWANRPSLGGVALLLGGPAVVNVFGPPLWAAAAVQWSLAALVWVFVVIAEARRTPDTSIGHTSRDDEPTAEEEAQP